MPVFVSYSHTNRNDAKAVIDDLQVLGHDVWYDRELIGGEKWWETILDHVRRCDLLVFVVSAASLESEACLSESRYARDLEKIVVPVLVNISPDLLPESLRKLQHVTYTATNADRLRDLARTLCKYAPPHFLPRPPVVPLPPPPIAPYPVISHIGDRMAAANLSLDEQKKIVQDLESFLRSERNWEPAMELLRRLKGRKDMILSVAKSVDDLLSTAKPRAERIPNRKIGVRVWIPICLAFSWAVGIWVRLATRDWKVATSCFGVVFSLGILYRFVRRK